MISLRAVRNSDESQLLAWRNDPDVARYMYSEHIIGAEEHRAWFRSARSDPRRLYWIIQCDGADVGLANLYDISEAHSRCSWAFYLGSANLRGRGVGSGVEALILDYVLQEGRYQKLYCEVLASNEAVIAMHMAFGFRQEGRLRSHIQKGSNRVDVVCLGILETEWREQRAQALARLESKGVKLDRLVPSRSPS